MPLQDVDLKAFTFIANNPKLRQEMIESLKREGYTDHPLIRENDDFERRLESHIKPLKEENAELKKRQDQQERERIWAKQRDSVRKAPFGFNDAKIKQLEEYMSTKDSGQYPEVDSQGRTAYQRAAMEYAHEHSPVSESTFPVLDFAGPSKKAETWRDLMNGSDKTKNPLHMNRRERRRLGDELWRAAKDEQLADMQNR